MVRPSSHLQERLEALFEGGAANTARSYGLNPWAGRVAGIACRRGGVARRVHRGGGPYREEDTPRSRNGSSVRKRELQILGAAALAFVIGAACLAAYSIHGSLHHNPIALPFEEQLSTRAWAPEGWKFFTRNPREERPVLFVQGGGRWRRAETGPASRPRYLFGLDRAGRVQGLELGLIFEQLPRGVWRDCDEPPLACIPSSAAAIAITNRSPKPTLCGPVGLALQKPIPWSWLKLPRPVVMPSRIVRLEIRC